MALRWLLVLAFGWWVSDGATADDSRPFTIRVVDEATGRGVPLVALTTVNQLRYYTDSAGIVAFGEPGCMQQTVFFSVQSHGYEFPADGFGMRGRKLQVIPGGRAELRVRRINIAERLYRVTGGGIYVESLQAAHPIPPGIPLWNAQVAGSDSVQAAIYQGKIHWFWGDTNRLSYPLGNFHAPGATSRLPADGGLPPDQGVALEYFLGADGFAKPTCQMPGEGPTWIDGLAVLPDKDGKERLFAHYLKVKPPLTVYEEGIAEFDDSRAEFTKRGAFPPQAKILPSGHSFRLPGGLDDHVYFAKPFPVIRVPATVEALVKATSYETFSCVQSGREDELIVERDEHGFAKYRWRNEGPRFTPELQESLRKSGQLDERDSLFRARDALTGKPITVHHGSLNWNAFRQRWILIAAEVGGTSMLGETWYAEADSPVGPWAYCVKIVSHDRQSFYNPKHHPFFDEDGGKRIYFEGTYTHSFSGNPEQTPRYDYNQMMYRLHLEDERLRLPRTLYRHTDAAGERLSWERPMKNGETFRHVAFCAPDRPFAGSVPVYAEVVPGGTRLTTKVADSAPLFFAWPAEAKQKPACTVPLFAWTLPDGTVRYAIAGEKVPEGRQTESPLVHVWPW